MTEEYDPDDPDEHAVPWNDPRVAAPMEHADPDPVRAGPAAAS